MSRAVSPFSSFQTVGELLQGAYMDDWGERRLDQLQAEISKYVVVPFDWRMVEVFARIRAQRRQIGRDIAVADAWIAATALSIDCPVLTHNVRDFADIPELTVISEPERSS